MDLLPQADLQLSAKTATHPPEVLDQRALGNPLLPSPLLAHRLACMLMGNVRVVAAVVND